MARTSRRHPQSLADDDSLITEIIPGDDYSRPPESCTRAQATVAFAASNNLLDWSILAPLLHPDVIHVSTWAPGRWEGRKNVLAMLSRVYEDAREGGLKWRFHSEVVEYRQAKTYCPAVLVAQGRRSNVQVLTRLQVQRGKVCRVHVAAKFNRRSVRRTGFYPPAG